MRAFVLLLGVTLAACADPSDMVGSWPRYNHPLDQGVVDSTDDAVVPPTSSDSGAVPPAAPASTPPAASPTKATPVDAGAVDAMTPSVRDAFTGAAAYVATTGASTQQGTSAHPFNQGIPAKQDCMTSSCHGPGGGGPTFVAGGTVFKDLAGSVPASQVEIRLLDADGTAVSTYTDANGNFFVKAGAATANLTFPLQTGARDGTTTRAMSAPISAGNCNSATCHGGTGTGVIHVP
jgi:hypothetical protein